MRFWDSSAIVPLIIEQAASEVTEGWLADDSEVAVWTLSAVEISSALRRLVREDQLGESQAQTAEIRAEQLLKVSHVVVDVEAVKLQARRLLRLHALRAADAMQLGAAMEWASGRPDGRVLCTLDKALARAAEREGFSVIP